MGGSSQQQQTSQTGQSQTNPWGPTLGQLGNLLGWTNGQFQNLGTTPQENTAFSGLMQNAQNGNPFAPGINSLATDLLNGGGPNRAGYTTDAYKQMQDNLSPIAGQSTNPYDNQTFQNFSNTMSNDISNRVKSQYAGAGYSPSGTGDFAQTLGRGISQGIAPSFVDAQNNLTSQKAGASNSLFQGGASTSGILSGLDQTALQNRQAGVGMSTAALNANDSPFQRMLQVAGQQRGAPLQNIAQLMSLILPMAGLGGSSNYNATGQSNTQYNPSLLGQIGQGVGIFRGLFGGGS